MSMREIERAITSEARRVFNNPKLRTADLMEWSTRAITQQTGEVVEPMPLNDVYVAIKVECDKRPNVKVRRSPATEGENEK